MAQTGWNRYAPYAPLGALVFGFMHIADELSGNWDAGAVGQPLGDPTTASIALGVMTLVGMVGLWWIVTDRGWGYVLAGLIGLHFFVTGGTHFFTVVAEVRYRHTL